MKNENSEITRIQEIYDALKSLDIKSVRSLRAVATGTATDTDKNVLADIENQLVKLRAELTALLTE